MTITTLIENNDGMKDDCKEDGVICKGCSNVFQSRNSMFTHLRKTKAVCLSPEDYKHYVEYVQSRQRVKTALLYGYIPSYDKLNSSNPLIRHGDDAASILMDVLFRNVTHSINTDRKFNRSFGNDSRSVDITRQDNGSGALSELICSKIPPLNRNETVEEWIETKNQELKQRLRGDDAEILIFGRVDMEHAKFNAEVDNTHCRMEYLLPVDFLYPNEFAVSRSKFKNSFPSFSSGQGDQTKKHEPNVLNFLFKEKKTMQLLTTSIVDFDPADKASAQEKEFHSIKQKRYKQQSKKNQYEVVQGINKEKIIERKDENKDDAKKPNKTVSASRIKKLLQRRRFHNFTPRLMVHEYMAFRRLDRFYHRATIIRQGDTICSNNDTNEIFFCFGLTGDLFLNGQVCRLVGLLVALLRGVVDEEFVDCIFDEDYPDLVPAPPAPSLGLYMGEASYVNWEGKCKMILSPRPKKNWKQGFNDEKVITQVQMWEKDLHSSIAKAWIKQGLDDGGRLTAERIWTEEVLEPWAIKAREQLKHYKQWKLGRYGGDLISRNITSPCLDSLDTRVPDMYQAVLHYLRKADASGMWPSTTPKRSLIMVSNNAENGEKASASLSMAQMKARSNNDERSSAYSFYQGQGGASGSFSVGDFPGGQKPKGNELFPELTKAAFELELVLMPNREPSSTIAINRNAQFRPHTDSGAGAGQNLSLIVGLGDYIGGDLVVEGVQKDIRYKAIEFNGWTQRHWTRLFRGERFSLVWFTPKGCEGLRGINLFRST
mmetsp:Transcript_18121/g.20910  ORF Transcript_18121/g.20910 Transcript_18121/m.20910 type:complete len:770 (-) Transcript_18121:7-2316(-)